MFTGKFDPGVNDLNIFTQNTVFAVCLALTSVAALFYTIFQKVSCFNRDVENSIEGGKFTDGSSIWSSICCKSVLDSICNNTERNVLQYDDIVTVKSMDISECGQDRQLPPEVNAAALATAQFLQAGGENALQSLSPSDRAKIAENRQVMRAYLISKLVAPRYDVDHDGKINPEHFKKGHLGSDDMEQRQSAMFHLVFNGQISVDTKATKRQQRDAIKRLKRCNKERHREKDLDKHLMSSKLSISEKETSGVGTDSNSMSSPNDKKKDHKQSKATVKRQCTKVTQESGLEISEHNHTSSEMIISELVKEIKTVNEKAQSKTRKPKEQSSSTLTKTKRLVKVKRTQSSSSESSTESQVPRTSKATLNHQNHRSSKQSGPDSAVGSMIQYDADVESLDRGRRRSDGTIESEQTEGVAETKRYLPDSYNESEEDESEDSLSFDEYDDVEESIVIGRAGGGTTSNQSSPDQNRRKIKRTHSEQLKQNETKIEIVETHSAS